MFGSKDYALVFLKIGARNLLLRANVRQRVLEEIIYNIRVAFNGPNNSTNGGNGQDTW